jgi:hypothetical protein
MTRKNTARDLAELARGRGEPVPALLASTVLVQTLAAVAARHRRGLVHRRLTADDVVLGADSLAALLADPSRDPKASLAAAAEPPPEEAAAAEAEDVGACAAVAVELLGTAGDRPPELAALLDRMLEPRPAARPSAVRAHAEARALALDLFAAWERQRRGPRLEERLRRALDERRETEAAELAAELEEVAPESLMLHAARTWLQSLERDRAAAATARRRLSAALYGRRRGQVQRQAERLAVLLGVRAGDDPDLRLARDWLAERHAVARRHSAALVLTAAPLLLATLLTGLLLAVMVGF